MSTRDDTLDSVFGALSDRTRRKILVRLAKGAATVGEIAKPFPMTLPAVSKHLDVLERAGLVKRARDGWYRRCTLDVRPLDAASTFLDDQRTFWEGTLDALAQYAANSKREKR